MLYKHKRWIFIAGTVMVIYIFLIIIKHDSSIEYPTQHCAPRLSTTICGSRKNLSYVGFELISSMFVN